jgi:hypothetical protein
VLSGPPGPKPDSPHPVNGFSLFALFFTLIAQGTIWRFILDIKASEKGDMGPWLRDFLWQLCYIPLFFAAWAGV